MKLAVFAFTRRGCTVARQVKAAVSFEQCRMFTMEKFGFSDFETYMPPLADFAGPVFHWADALVFVGSTGMAVRAIAPWVSDKKTDPAVLVLDEGTRFVISLLSGHIGGANALTRLLAKELGATPVITTATDVNGRFSVDDWAARKGLAIGSMEAARAVSAAILEGDVPLCSDYPVSGELPVGLTAGESGPVGIYIGYRDLQPFGTTLRLIPRVLQLGLGCRRGTDAGTIARVVQQVLEENSIPREAIRGCASVDLKAHEQGLLEFCGNWNLPVTFYTPEELRGVPGEFPASDFVKSIAGVDNVCQRSAMAGAKSVVIEKTARDGVTVSLGEIAWEVAF